MISNLEKGLLSLAMLLGLPALGGVIVADNSPGVRYWLALIGLGSLAVWMVLVVTVVGRLAKELTELRARSK